jgi:glycosyltransferase involved in cell wall biosynthesis
MNVLFVGIGTTARCWYRCALPARALGADWIGVGGHPTALVIRTGQLSRDIGSIEDLATYDVVVLQQPHGNAWRNAIAVLQRHDTRVLFEIDCDVHASATLSEAALLDVELAMRACDGLICSTAHIAARYRSVNSETWVCADGIDLGRYALTRSPRETVTIGWAGGTGHQPAPLAPWLRELVPVLSGRPATRFMSIGPEGCASALAERFGPTRCIELPRGPIETYPAAMSSFDIALAPAPLHRGKGELRWLEASALGVPTVADPEIYRSIQDGVTGLHAATPAQAREAIMALVDDDGLRERIGSAARAYVREHRCIQAVAPRWELALAGGCPAAQAA